MSDIKKVMISSTARDLPEHRAAAEVVCKKLRMYPDMMEYLTALDADAQAASVEMAKNCDVYVLIVANRYGYIPAANNPAGISVTQMEYEAAERFGKPRLIFLLDPAHTPPFPEEEESPDHRQKLAAFKERLGYDRVRATFRSVDHLAMELATALAPYQAADPNYRPPALPPPGELAERGGLPPGYRLYHRPSETFQGRGDELKTLAEGLLYRANGSMVINGVTGSGGLGKTQLAVEFAYRYGRFFHGVHWINTSLDWGQEIAACGAAMDLPGYPQTLPEQIAFTLKAWRAPSERLLILDNLDSEAALQHLNDWLPKLGPLRLLITSRRGEWPAHLGLKPLALPVLDPDSSRALLRKLAPHLAAQPDGELDKIGAALGYMPLAVDLVGHYIKQGRLSPAEFLAEWAAQPNPLEHPALVNWVKQAANPTQHDTHVAGSWLLSWRGLGDDETAKTVFALCGLCAPNRPIPRALLIRALQDNPKADIDPLARAKLGAALEALLTWGLLELDDEAQASIHPLLAAFARSQAAALPIGPLAAAMARESFLALNSGLPAQFTPLLGHIEVIGERAEAAGLSEAAVLWNNLGSALQNFLGDYPAARAYYERALRIFEKELGENHPNVATLVNNLGTLLQDQGDYPAARDYLERALRIDEASYGPDHPNVAIRVNNLGLLLKALGDYPAARAYYERALRIDEATYGPDHPEVATDVNNLGQLLKALGDYPAARAYLERALRIDEASYGPDHPNVAIRVNNLGLLLQALGDYPAARAYYERALRIDEATYGPDHPEVATDVNNLGQLLKALGDYPAARAYLERALRMDEASYGPDHPNVAIRVNNLGTLLKALGDYPAARAYMERALQMDEATYGPDHPNVARDVNNLGMLLKALGDYPAARAYMERALRMDEATYGPDHPNVASDVNNLGTLAYAEGDLRAALPLFERALRIFQHHLPPTHPNIQMVQNSLAIVRGELGEG